MRTLANITVAISLTVGPALAAEDQSTPLAPGKPSGVSQAQGFAPNYTVLFLGALLIVGVGGIYLATHNVDNGQSTTGTSP